MLWPLLMLLLHVPRRLRTQAYMDNSTSAGNIVAMPRAKAAMGGVATGKHVRLGGVWR